MKRLFFAIFLSFLVLPSSVNAQTSEAISSFQSNITLLENGQAEIQEVITYDFKANQRHGIFRVIPTRYDTEGESFYEVDINVLSVLRNDEEEPYKTSKTEDGISIRIGDPDETISGEHTYMIAYQTDPLILNAKDEDIFRYDITGNNWDAPIQRVEAVVVTESEPLAKYCYTGKEGSTNSTCQSGEISKTAHFFEVNSPLSPGENFTVELSFADGTFTNYAESQKPGFLDKYPPELLLGGLLGVGLLSAIVGLLWSWLKYHWRKKQELIVPQYEPPENFTPGELGLLADNVSNNVEFSATLIDLAVRGFLKIEQTKKPGLFSKGKYTLHKLKPFKDEDLQGYEATLLRKLFSNNDKVNFDNISASTMQTAIRDMHKNLKKRLVEKGYYKPSNFKFKITSAVATIIAFILFFFVPFIGFAIFFFVSVTGALKGGLFLFKRMTAKGYSGWAGVEGFKEFLSMTEKDRVAFHYAPEKNPQKFSEYLPYAVALGVEKQWAKQFEETEALRDQNWYASSGGYFATPTALAGDLSKGFNSYVKSSSVSGSSISSGSSFSGGGFGGGGGGSW